MSRWRFELATPEDDADLRHVLAATPMPGTISVSFRREPSYFGAAVVEGPFRQVVVARDKQSGTVVGFGSRSVREMYVNGQPLPVGYLSSLRLLNEHRNRGLVARGYAFFRKLHHDGRAKVYITTIAEGNDRAVSLLTSARAGLPRYYYAGKYYTLALPLSLRERAGVRGKENVECRSTNAERMTNSEARKGAPRGMISDGAAAGMHVGAAIHVRHATPADLSQVLEFLQELGPRRQFFPCYAARDFFTENATFKDLQPGDLLLAYRENRLVGLLGGWDQQAFKQTVVHGYARNLRWTRPLYNGWARLRDRPGLPAPGATFRYVTAMLPLVRDDDPGIFALLLEELRRRAAGTGANYLLVGLHEADPLLSAIRVSQATRYVTRLYIVCYDDGESLRQELDDRPPYLELGCL